MRQVEPGFRQLPIWFWPGFALVIPLLFINEYAAGLVGALIGGFGSGRDYGWRRREREEIDHEARKHPSDECGLCGAQVAYGSQEEDGTWTVRCAGCAPAEMVAAGGASRIEVESRVCRAMTAAMKATCWNGLPTCYCKVGWPIELQCEDCRGEEPRTSRCICGPVDRIFKEDA